MSSNTASDMVESLALAALRTTDGGRPLASPVRPPFDGAQAEGVDADPLKVDPASLAELVQQQRLELLEHPAPTHSSSRRQQVVAEPQPSSLPGSRLQGVEVRAMNTSAATQLRSGNAAWHAAAGSGWWRWQQVLDTPPQLVGEESIHEASHAKGASQNQPEALKLLHRVVPECP
jgi:hypothetical protein